MNHGWRLAVYLIVVSLLLAEIVVRIFFAVQIGPRTLLYGTEWHRNSDQTDELARQRRTAADEEFQAGITDHMEAEDRQDSVEKHENHGDGYTKFFANEQKSTRDVDTGERIPTSINSMGFRGPEFSLEKPAGVVRVLTLGASSTFGFYDRDDETYPYYLEQELNRRCAGGTRFEVINFGIPHASSYNVAELFLAEGLPVDPDVVTFYQGRNDSTLMPEYDGVIEKAYSVLVHRLLLVAFLDQVIVGERESVTAASQELEPRIRTISDEYLQNLERIRQTAVDSGTLLVVANQQATSAAPYPRVEKERLMLKGVTYQEEADALRARFDAGEEIDTFQFSFLVHQGMMQALERWANDNGVPFVDVIGALDEDRHYLLSWVHLHPEANKIVAAQLAEPILSAKCREPVMTAGGG